MRRDSVGKMKNLDEVITANECCDHGEPDSRCEDCPYNGIGACCAEREADALQWLKGYRAHIELDKLRDKCETENDPLSWDELKSMGGKPVWVEYSGYTPNWEIVENTGAVRGSTGDFTGRFVETNMSILRKEDQGITWKVYRKERA